MSDIRLDRIATLYFFHPLQRLVRPVRLGIPILMYHSVSNAQEAGRSSYFRICTAPRIFRKHMDLLARNGYTVIGLGQAVEELKKCVPDITKPVLITFDDGYQDFYTEAFPILNLFGFTATVFLPTAYIGDSCRDFNGKPCLTWSQVRELYRAGIDFGSHTVTHPHLTALLPPAIQRELIFSKREIEDQLGAPVPSFSYPYKFPEPDHTFRQCLRDTLLQAGYERGVSTILGTAASSSDRLFLERIPVNSGDDATLFAAKLNRGYDWLHCLQLASKFLAGDSAAS